MLTTVILAHEFPNMFVVRGKKIAVIQAFITRIQNERIAFDICGLFSITSKTFISILRITTSFVLILIQFNPHPSVRNNPN
ncbi:hypothetical protein WDU94_005106 [Cyamophila willieti]